MSLDSPESRPFPEVCRSDGPWRQTWPRYDGHGLGNLPARICRILGADPDGMLPGLVDALLPERFTHGIRSIVLVLADGLGASQLQRAVEAGIAPRLASLGRDGDSTTWAATLTSVFPSSTVPALTSLATGVAPSRHGLIGWITHLPELGGATEVVRWGPARSPGSWLQMDPDLPEAADYLGLETVHQRLARAGAACHMIGPSIHLDSPFTRMLYGGATYHPCDTIDRVPALVAELLVGSGPGRCQIQVYYPLVDAVAHSDGPSSPLHAQVVQELDRLVGGILDLAARREEILVMVTADHGHISTEARYLVDFAEHESLLGDLLLPPTGDRRAIYFHARPGRIPAVRRYLEERLADQIDVYAAADVFARGLFGPGESSPQARRNAGDLVAIARGTHQLVCSGASLLSTLPHAGDHGALHAEEMEVPLLAARGAA
jgi:hypothetical protein